MKRALALLALPLLTQQSVNLYSVEKERALGRQLATDIRQSSMPLVNTLADAYVKRVGSQLVAHLEETPYTYSFEVIRTAGTSEPIPLPGGYILTPARFFLVAQDEAEFAGMLAHAIGHTALRHGTRAAIPSRPVNTTSIPLVFMGGRMGCHADSQRAALLVPVGLSANLREYELEADRFGVELAARAGYDATAFRRYIDRTQEADSKGSLLPARETRLARIDELLRAAPAVQPSPTDEFQRIQRAVRDEIK